MSMTLAQSTAAGLGRTYRHTDSGKVHKTGEGDDPEALTEEYVTTIKLEE